MDHLFDLIRKNPSRFYKTSVLCFSSFAIYIAFGTMGPTLLDLAIQVDSSLSQVGTSLPARAVGYVVGSLVVGIIYHRVNMMLYSAVCIGISAVATAMIPHTSNLYVIIGIFALEGYCWGAIEAGGNMIILQIWGKEVSPFLQLFYFTSGLGSFIAPFFVEPFLVKVKSSSPVTNTSHANITPNDLQLVFPYSFAAFMLFVASASLFMTWKISPILEEHPSRRLPVNSTERSDVVKKDKNHVAWFNFYKFVVIVLSLIYANVYYGLFVTVGSFLVSYAAKSDMSLTKTDGARLTSLFWGAFSFWRLGTLFYQQYLGNGKIIIMSLFLSLIGTVILPFAHSSIICLWVSVAIIGIGISPVWPALFGYLEQYFTVSSKVSSAMCISAQFGEFVFPLIVSYFLEQVPQVFLWVSMFCTISISVAIGSVMIIANYKLHTQE